MVTAVGVPRERVIAIEAELADGRQQFGTGFLAGGRLVLTAEHCTRDKETGEPAVTLRVVRAGAAGTASVVAVASCPGLDVAVLTLGEDAPWDADLPRVAFARVDRRYSGMLENCEGIGYPFFQRNPAKGSWNTSEVHGTIYLTDEAETGRLMMREPLIRPGILAGHDTSGVQEPGAALPSPWGGLSGALLFHAGLAIGVIVEHHPRQGESALRAIGFEKIAKTAATDPAARQLAEILGLPACDELPLATGDPVQPLAGLVDLLDDTDANDLPLVRNLNPYLLGATPTDYGNRKRSGVDDPYVPRTHHYVDTQLATALEPGRMVLLVGPSKAGKTRTAFEAIRTRWPQARLLAPDTSALAVLAKHPILRTSSDTVVVWLDDLQRYLTGISDPLTPALLTSLLARPGHTVVMATLRTDKRAALLGDNGDLTRDTRRVLEAAIEVGLGPTSDDPVEQAAAEAAYPAQDLFVYGLAEQLAGAPYLLRQYRDARHTDPLLHTVIRTAIDWARVGMQDPFPEKDLVTLALDTLAANQPNIRTTPKKVRKAIEAADTPPVGAGRVAALETILLPDRTRGYRPFSYLVSADDGQSGPTRPVPESMWNQALERASKDAAFSVGVAAYYRSNREVALRASERAANDGHTGAMFNLGVLLVEEGPSSFEEARTWFEQAANGGHTNAMVNLGVTWEQCDPPDLAEARWWYQQAADAGNAEGMFNLGRLLQEQDPPDLDGAHCWYEQAADAGHIDAVFNLGFILAGQDPPKTEDAHRCYAQAANAGHTGAMFNLGIILAGQDPPKTEDAHRCFAQAAIAGHTGAMFNLGILLSRQDPPDVNAARSWYEQAANAGYTDAMVNLGALLQEQSPPDLKAARRWWQEAANAGHTGAKFNLGLLAMKQDPPDLTEALTWYEQAAREGHTGAISAMEEVTARLGGA